MFLQVQEFAEQSDAILLVVVPAASVREVGTSKALKLAQELDSDGTPTINMFVYLNSRSALAQTSSMPFLVPDLWPVPSQSLTFYRLPDLKIVSQIAYPGKCLTRNNIIG